MLTRQIVFICIIFLVDVGRIIHLNVFKQKRIQVGHPDYIFDVFRIFTLYAVLLIFLSEMNRLNSPNPCPQFEHIEDAYRIKL